MRNAKNYYYDYYIIIINWRNNIKNEQILYSHILITLYL